MKITSPPPPDVWVRLSRDGPLRPPLRRHPTREFLSTDEGLIELRCPAPPQRQFDPERDVVMDLSDLLASVLRT